MMPYDLLTNEDKEIIMLQKELQETLTKIRIGEKII